MDVEVPRGPHSINSRHSLAAAVGLRRRPPKGDGSILEALLKKSLPPAVEESGANHEPRTDDSPAKAAAPESFFQADEDQMVVSESTSSSENQPETDANADLADLTEEGPIVETDVVISNLLDAQEESIEAAEINCDTRSAEPGAADDSSRTKQLSNAPSPNKILISSACRTKLPINKTRFIPHAPPAVPKNDEKPVDELIEEAIPVAPVTEKNLGTRPLTLPSAMELKSVLLGTPEGQFFKDWRESELFVSADKFRDATESGISGVLAVLQGFVAKEMTFCRVADEEEAFVTAVAQILWQSGQNAHACLAICGEEERLVGCGRYRRDGLTEAMLVLHLGSADETRAAVQRHADQLRAPGGLLLLVASLVLSKGLDEFRGRAPLLSKANVCLVNLTLTGRLDMREAKQRAQVGLLSLAEHYGHLKVPSCLKTPRWPVWVVELGPDKYSVILSTNAKLVADWRAELAFRLQIYDADGIKNAAITTGGELNEEEEKAASYLEMTIRTKWSGAQIQWIPK
ncbi:Hypothetical predicted protein [Cloeon dipterum]|uniref:Ubiquitin carboxyl-terminal hydrolase MINDY n=1 Tax=Cloeon dipterum TaxID=197152 RepID=A0A8S1DHV5_9INSE|nr:Hypothetical predicted protein [Cloeon dipterum]